MSVQVIVDNKNIEFPNQKPKRFKNPNTGEVSNTIYVPIDPILNEMGYSTYNWNVINLGILGKIPVGIMVASNGNKRIVISERNELFVVNNLYFSYDSCGLAWLVGGSLFLPVRKFFECIGCQVDWEKNGEDEIISITTAPETYTVTFDKNGGTMSSQSENFTVSPGTSIVLPEPIRSGYIFEGWYTEKENGTRIGSAEDEYAVNANLTFYALWGKNNYSFDTAREIKLNQVLEENISSFGNDDYYKISFRGCGEVKFRLQLFGNAQYNMYIYDADNISTHIAHAIGTLGGTILIPKLVDNKSYYIRIYAPNSSSIDTTTDIGYSLQVMPTEATEIDLTFENSTHLSTNTYALSYVTTPENAYTECKYISYNSDIAINGNNITAAEDGVTIVTVTDEYSNLSDNRLLIFDLLPPNHTIAMPANKNCNWNQKHTDVTQYFGDSACTLVAGLDIANFYSTNESGYTPEDMHDDYYWSDDDGFWWRIPGQGYLREEYTFTDELPDEINDSLKNEYILQHYIHYIKKEIYSDRPVMINLGPHRGNNHSVVAYKYMDTPVISRGEEPTEMNKIQVYDPENSATEADKKKVNGRDVTLWEAFRYNFISNPRQTWKTFFIWSIRPTSTG